MSNITCSVDGCAKSVSCRGWCKMHYNRWHRTGSLDLSASSRAVRYNKNCLECRAEFNGTKIQKFCRADCRTEYHLRSKLDAAELTCRICGGAMYKSKTSLPQGEAAHVKCRKSDPARFSDCPICGDQFEPYSRGSRGMTRTCSKPCGMRLAIREGTHNLQDGKQVGRDMAKVERNWRKRRALKLRAKSEPYTKEEIAARDNYICYLCGDPVDMSLVWPDDGFPSVDHVVALANGGDDTPSNVRITHLSCNISKGTKALEEVQHGSKGVTCSAG